MLPNKKEEASNALTLLASWRRRWDSNPRTLADQTISSRSRYDHFDTSPYLSHHQHLGKRGELMGRTKKNIKLKNPEKPRKIKGSQSRRYRTATAISSAPSYDLLSTSPYLIVQHRLANISEKCKISMQDKRIQPENIPRGNPAVTPFAADESASGLQTFECDLFGLLSTSPQSKNTYFYNALTILTNNLSLVNRFFQ